LGAKARGLLYCPKGIESLGAEAYSDFVMLKCVLCGADTILEVESVPICVKCDDQKETGKNLPPFPSGEEVRTAAAAR
jgi:hypothetical protein